MSDPVSGGIIGRLKRFGLYASTLASVAVLAGTAIRFVTDWAQLRRYDQDAKTSISSQRPKVTQSKSSDDKEAATSAAATEAGRELAQAIEYRDGKAFRLEGVEIFDWAKAAPGKAQVSTEHLRCVKFAKTIGVTPIFLALSNNISIAWPNVKSASISCRADGNSVEFDLGDQADLPNGIVGLTTVASGMFGINPRRIAAAARTCVDKQSGGGQTSEPDVDFVRANAQVYVSCRVAAGDIKLTVRSARSWIVRAHLDREQRKRAEKDIAPAK